MKIELPTVRSARRITIEPIAESIARHRTFTVTQAQFLSLLDQLHAENFTGSLTFHMNSGRICNVETVEKQRI